MPVDSEENEAQSGFNQGNGIRAEPPLLLPSVPRMALVPQGRVRAQLSITALSYLLKREVRFLKAHMEEVSKDRQKRGSRRVVVWTLPFEEIGKEQKDDSTQQEGAGVE